jgi:two-component system sensor histidine kinase KdpD
VAVRILRSSIGVLTALALGVCMLPFRAHLSIATAGLVLVVPVVVGVIAGGYPGGIAAVATGFLVYDFAYIPPYNTLTVGAVQNWAPLGVYVVVMLLVAQVVAHLRAARASAQSRENEARRLYTLSELTVEGGSVEQLLETVVRAIATVFKVEGAAVLLPVGDRLEVVASEGRPLDRAELDRLAPGPGVPVAGGARPVGTDLRTLVLSAASGPVGLLALRGWSGPRSDDQLLQTFANHAALALERVQLRIKAMRTELLEEVEKVRRDLIGAVSHDLRTPLATMKVASSTLLGSRSGLSQQELEELYTLLDVQIDRLSRLVTSLLDLNRYERGVLRVERRPCAVLDLVGDTLAGMRATLGDRQVELRVPDSLPMVNIDPILMSQVLTNLVDNADRHSPQGEAVEISADLLDGRVSLCVSDHGCGVPEDERELLFHSFVRFDTGGRAGLGLAIARAFVEAHGERIWVEDAPGNGARFVVTMTPSQVIEV